MTIDELIKFMKVELTEFLFEPAETLYSAKETFSRGDIYLLGTNPGGSNNYTLDDDLKMLETKTTNGYLDEVWENNNGNPAKGKNILQIRIQKLLCELGFDIRSVCASNLIFLKSTSIDKLGYKFNSIADKCWPIHEKILETVQPKVIIVFGNGDNNSPYAYLKKKFTSTGFDTIPTGHGTYRAKSFEISYMNNQKIIVIGLPHLSRFNLKNHEVYDWIKNKIASHRSTNE